MTGRSRALGAAILAAWTLLVAGCRSPFVLDGRSAELQAVEASGRTVSGAERFVFGDVGGLNAHTMDSHALPWKVVVAGLVLRERRSGGERSPERILRDFGFLRPETVANWPEDAPAPRFERPLGIVAGEVRRGVPRISLEVANLGCASCHAGVTYDDRGRPLPSRVWLGLPNTSLDLEAYTRAVFEALRAEIADRSRLLATVRELFPALSAREEASLRRFVLPRIERRMAELERLGAPTPFPNGGPGITNGVAALKSELGLLDPTRRADEFGFVSIPDLGDRGLRTSVLVDGAYTLPGAERFATVTVAGGESSGIESLAPVAAFFTVPTLGAAPAAVPEVVPSLRSILGFLADYRPPRFPGPIDGAAAQRGAEVYRGACASCHGRTSAGVESPRLAEYPNRLSPQDEMGTDPTRWQTLDEELVRAIRRSAYGDRLDATTTGGYVAPILSGLWATAPYLHNGSVPTLWHLLRPAERPERFEVGGHHLDLDRVGVALGEDGRLRLPGGEEPWARPALYDTTRPGRSNAGHERPVEGLGEGELDDLLEYLKLL